MTTDSTRTRTAGLDVRGLSAGYGSAPVVSGLDLHVEPGEVVAMLGRNGAGKTTTLMAIGGFLKRCTGTVAVDGVTVGGAPHRRMRQSIGLVLEGRSVFAPLTTAQNLKVGRVPIAEAMAVFPELEA